MRGDTSLEVHCDVCGVCLRIAQSIALPFCLRSTSSFLVRDRTTAALPHGEIELRNYSFTHVSISDEDHGVADEECGRFDHKHPAIPSAPAYAYVTNTRISNAELSPKKHPRKQVRSLRRARRKQARPSRETSGTSRRWSSPRIPPWCTCTTSSSTGVGSTAPWPSPPTRRSRSFRGRPLG